jgi:septum formation topological specificity factor MinE
MKRLPNGIIDFISKSLQITTHAVNLRLKRGDSEAVKLLELAIEDYYQRQIEKEENKKKIQQLRKSLLLKV